MAEARPPSAHSMQYVPSLLGSSDQACNECKRRKGRCDRQLPECGPCARNKRHCLYERHSKTPLTRKYLTEVEARLRQTERRAAEAEHRAADAESRLRQNSSPPNAQSDNRGEGLSNGSAASDPQAIAGVLDSTPYNFAGFDGIADTTGADWDHLSSTLDNPGLAQFGGVPPNFDSGHQRVQSHDLELPPPDAEDFSWDEQSIDETTERKRMARGEQTNDDDLDIDRSMASLAIEERGSGYLGLASGAAMLKLMVPDREQRRTSRTGQPSQAAQLSTPIMTQPLEQGRIPTSVWAAKRIGEVDLNAAIDKYFSMYHQFYPIVHEPSFRAQYNQVIPRPNGRTWNALAYMIAAIGTLSTATQPGTRDLDLFEAAKSNLTIDSFESGNLTLVQVLALMANYLQKRNKPNSGYNYLGLALHAAMGLGLHKEFHNWQISPLNHEIRRRVWWTLYILAAGAMITFGRPFSWPAHGIEVALPLNVDDQDLTNVSITLPPPDPGMTTYYSVAVQSRFHTKTSDIYERVISRQFPTASEMLRLDDENIERWRLDWANEDYNNMPYRFRFPRIAMEWRYRNFRVIMYRPFLLRQVLQMRTITSSDEPTRIAIERCLHEAKSSIYSLRDFWSSCERNGMMCWYALYYLFQASMIPCICLRNDLFSEHFADWQEQISIVLSTMSDMHYLNAASRECHQVISNLCAGYLTTKPDEAITNGPGVLQPTEESPQTQINNIYGMMWTHATSMEADAMMPDESWTAFINDDFGTNSPGPMPGTQDQSPWT